MSKGKHFDKVYVENYLRENAGKIPSAKMAEELNLQKVTLRGYAWRLGIDLTVKSYVEEIEKKKKTVAELYGKMTVKDIAAKMGISPSSVTYYAYKVGVLRPARTKEVTHNGRFFNEKVHQDWIIGGKIDKY